MSEPEQEQPTQEQEQPTEEPTEQTGGGDGYHVSDLTEGQKPDPLGDASLSAKERATATSDD